MTQLPLFVRWCCWRVSNGALSPCPFPAPAPWCCSGRRLSWARWIVAEWCGCAVTGCFGAAFNTFPRIGGAYYLLELPFLRGPCLRRRSPAAACPAARWTACIALRHRASVRSPRGLQTVCTRILPQNLERSARLQRTIHARRRSWIWTETCSARRRAKQWLWKPTREEYQEIPARKCSNNIDILLVYAIV